MWSVFSYTTERERDRKEKRRGGGGGEGKPGNMKADIQCIVNTYMKYWDQNGA